jgi:hypothetical protein
LAGSVGTRRNDATLVWASADGKCLPTKLWMAGFFDGAEEGIQIQVHNGLLHAQPSAGSSGKVVIFGIEDFSGNRYTI